MLAAFDRHFKERDYMYSITRDREFCQSKFSSARGKSKTSSPARKREEAERGKCTEQRRENTMDSKHSRRFQSTSYFSEDVVESN